MTTTAALPIYELWHSDDVKEWEKALKHYWDFVKPGTENLNSGLRTST